jgi:hypothetical protein
MRVRRYTHVPGVKMKTSRCTPLPTKTNTGGHGYSIALSIAILVTAGCTRAGVSKGNAHAMKPVPASMKSDSGSVQNADTTTVTPKVWELTALAPRKGPSVAS